MKASRPQLRCIIERAPAARILINPSRLSCNGLAGRRAGARAVPGRLPGDFSPG